MVGDEYVGDYSKKPPATLQKNEGGAGWYMRTFYQLETS